MMGMEYLLQKGYGSFLPGKLQPINNTHYFLAVLVCNITEVSISMEMMPYQMAYIPRHSSFASLE